MAVGRTIWWPAARPDFAGDSATAVLQHELQHLLDYAEGAMSPTKYLLNPRHWRYGVQLSLEVRWDQLGAEQRASLAEDLWYSENNGDAERTLALRAVIGWATAYRPRAVTT